MPAGSCFEAAGERLPCRRNRFVNLKQIGAPLLSPAETTGVNRVAEEAIQLLAGLPPERRQALQQAVLSRIATLGFVPMVVVSTCMTLAGSALFVIGDSRADSQWRLLDGSDPTNDTLGYTPTDARNNHAHVLFTAGSSLRVVGSFLILSGFLLVALALMSLRQRQAERRKKESIGAHKKGEPTGSRDVETQVLRGDEVDNGNHAAIRRRHTAEDKRNEKALRDAAENGEVEVVKGWLKQGVDINAADDKFVSLVRRCIKCRGVCVRDEGQVGVCEHLVSERGYACMSAHARRWLRGWV